MPIPETEVRAMIEDASRRDYAVLVCGRDVVALHNHKPIFDEIFVKPWVLTTSISINL